MKGGTWLLLAGVATVFLGGVSLWSATETHAVKLPTGSTYYFSFPFEVQSPGTITAQITCENEINMPEGRTLQQNPLFVIIYQYDDSKQLHNRAYKYFMNALTLTHSVTAAELQGGKNYIVGVRNTNARVKADCSLEIRYPGPRKAIRIPHIRIPERPAPQAPFRKGLP